MACRFVAVYAIDDSMKKSSLIELMRLLGSYFYKGRSITLRI